ncbi:MAG: polyprenyl synthetase family protein [Candidatus Woesearchaeota archaeon]
MTLTLKDYKQLVDHEIEKFFNKKIRKAQRIDESSVELLEFLKDFCSGGKRIRAAMLYYGYRCFKNNNVHEAIKASMSIELIHSYLLIHDDIIDNDNKRRGGPTVHYAYQKLAQKRYKNKDAKHFGISFAIIAGDILCAFANEILTKLDLKEKYKTGAIRKLNHIIHQAVYGEALDILSSYKHKLTPADVEKIHHLKTAAYTFEGPMHMGAVLARANKKQLRIMSKYGVPLGKAFQIQDDILGLFGDETTTGKPADSDLKEGKKTLLIVKALESADEKQKQIIKSALGNQNLTTKQLEQVRNIVKQTGSLEYCQNLAKSLIKQARSAIKKSRFKREGKKFLLGEIADYMLERKK